MAWKPIADRIATLPMVLAGPILRRVEKDNVSVWLALKEPCLAKDQKQLSLEVYDSGTGTVKGSLVMSGCRDTVSLGEHLHIVVLTAKASGILLRPGVTYSYNVTGNGVDFTNKQALCYTDAGFTLPTFSLPPANLNQLRIIHASCRKLHAQGTDALADVDGILKKAASVPGTMPTTRPHQLFLTGDQIYADDVDPVLLFLIRDLCDGADAALDIDAATPRTSASGLLNWTEELRGGSRYSDRGRPHLAAGYPLSQHADYEGALEVGRRSELLREESGLHFPGEWETADNHLIKLGEFYAMYLLMWSPELWPLNTEYPEYRNVYSKKYFKKEPKQSDNPKDVGEAMAQNSSAGAGDKGTYAPYLRSVTRAQLYQDELRAVRKALANIPTYMICDDHEITDDWFLDYNWCETVLSRVLGNRIVQNGLTAYTLFQSWGNTPAQFEQPTGQRLLALMPRWEEPDNYDNYNPAAPDGWPTMGACVGMPALYETLDQHRLVPINPDHLKHHFYIAWDKHEVVVLDTRTARDFPGSKSDYAALISRESLQAQLGEFAYNNSSVEVTFIIIATPISGIPNVEEKLLHNARYAASAKIAYSEHLANVIAFGLLTAAKMVSTNDRNYYTDAEGYGYQQKGLQDLYAGICRSVVARQHYDPAAAPGRIIVLSGDVHYGFTNRLEFWGDRFADMAETDSRNVGTTHFVMAQLCASALKNEKEDYTLGIATGTFGDGSVDTVGYSEEEILEPNVWLGWIPPAQGIKPVGFLYYPNTTPRDMSRKYWVSWHKPVIRIREDDLHFGLTDFVHDITPPDWMYRINYIKALRPPVTSADVLAVSDPATGPAATPQQRLDALKSYTAASQNDRKYLLQDASGSEAVGRNNFGEVTFDWGATEATKFVRHYLWWSKPGGGGVDEERQAHSKFVVLMGQDNTQYPKPTAPYTH
jgi:hypothetical protein